MDIVHSLAGMVEAEITGGDIPASLMALYRAGIHMESVEYIQDFTVRVCVSRRNCRTLKSVCEKRGDCLLLRKRGIYWKYKVLSKHPVLCIGILILLFLLFFLPTKVLFFRVEGNERIPARRILESAENCGIRFGASRREVRSERMKNALLQQMPELQWAGINTYGCVGVISVRERTAYSEKADTDGFCHVVALRSGIVTSCTATRGNLLCQPGEAVLEGQILISGYTDCGICIQASGAAGEVYATTNRKIRAVMPSAYRNIQPNGRKYQQHSILIGKKRINLWKDSGISDDSCGRIYEEKYLTLPGDFQLPFGWATDTWIIAPVSHSISSTSAEEQLLRSFADAYIRQHMIAGQIEAKDIKIIREGDLYLLDGEYICTEMIGKRQEEQIGETNGKSG